MMKLSKILLGTSSLLLVLSAAYAASHARQDPAEMMPPKPGPQHEWLASHLGTWDCTVEGMGEKTKGTWVAEAGPGGLWTVGTFHGEMMGTPFEGREFMGYDPAKERFVSVWIDSWITAPMTTEGTYDKTARQLRMTGKMPGPDGSMVDGSMVTDYPDENTMIFTLAAAGPDGQMAEMMKITYKRRK